jgi:hypothetical protein
MALTLIVILRIRWVYWAFCVSESVWGPRGDTPILLCYVREERTA